MAKQDNLVFEGTITENLSNDKFKVELDNGHEVTCYPNGKMRKNYIKVMIGDRVDIEISPYDLTCGRITRRHKSGPSQMSVYHKNKK